MVNSPFLLWICRLAGTGLAITSIWLTVSYGLTISVGIALALGIASFMASYIWPIVIEVQRNADQSFSGYAVRGMAVALAIPLTMLDATTNSSTTGVHRVADIQKATLQDTRHDDARRAVADLEAQQKFFTNRIAELQGSKGWHGVKPSAAYDGDIQASELAIAQETRRGGCGPKCLELTQGLAELKANQATSAAHEKAAKMLAASVEGLRKAREASAVTETGNSAVATQNLKLASLFTLDRKPSEGAQWWTDTTMMLWIGVIITLASQFFNLMAWLPSSSGTHNRTSRSIGFMSSDEPRIKLVPDTALAQAISKACGKLAA